MADMTFRRRGARRPFRARAARPAVRARRGSALFLVLVLSVALAALALSAIFLSSHATLTARAFDREREYRYAAEAALAMGRSRLTVDTTIVLDDSLPTVLLTSAAITGADGKPLPSVRVNSWAARSGVRSGQFGLFASVIVEARDSASTGARFVRRLELQEENFARFLDWFDVYATPGCFGASEVLDGPVFANANICDQGARFRDTVATAGVISPRSGIYEKGYLEARPAMRLPSLARLSRLPTLASTANLSITAPTTGDATGARLRIEFVWWDLNGNGTSLNEPNEGFIRVYQATAANRNRADYRQAADDVVRNNQCGDWHWDQTEYKFYPYAVHGQSWFSTQMKAGDNINQNRIRLGYPWTNNGDVNGHVSATRADVMQHTRASTTVSDLTPRCFPIGDPRLAAVERGTTDFPTASTRDIGGTSLTFTPRANDGANGQWLLWPGAAVTWTAFTNPPPVNMRAYLWPLDRSLNANASGVIYVNGTVAVHGRLRGRVTLYAAGDVTFVDDLTYANDPSAANAPDVLGVISAQKITIADNGINTPQNPVSGGDAGYVWMDNDRHFTLHGVLLALNTFMPERWWVGPTSMSSCNGVAIGRGCIYQVGGSIVRNREATASSPAMTGFLESRSYDRRLSNDSPPYFPTTGRYIDNRFYEVDAQGFDITTYLRRIR